MDTEEEEEYQSTSLGQVAQKFKRQVDAQVRDENDNNEEYYDEEYPENTSIFMLTKVFKCQVDEVVEDAFKELKIDLRYLTSKTGTIEFKTVMKMLEETWKTINYDLERLYKVPCQSLGNEKRETVSRCRLSHVLETALNEAKDGLSVLYGQKQPHVMSIEVDTVLRQLEIAKKSISDQLNYPPIDTLPDLVLLRIFRYLPLCETIHFRRVCPRFQTLLDEKCRSITSLKLFAFCYFHRFSYISEVHNCQLSQPADDHLHLHHDGRADDLTILRPKAESIQQIANQFRAIQTLVFVHFKDTFLLPLFSLSVFTNLTTLVISHNRFSWTSLTSFTSLRRLYLFQIYNDDEVDNFEAAAIVLGRLTCLMIPSLSTKLVSMLSVEMKQLRCFILSKSTWIELCSRLSALTYLHIPFTINYKNITALELFRPLMSLPNLVELSLESLSVLPSISEIRAHSLELPTVKKILFNTLEQKWKRRFYCDCNQLDDGSSIEPIIALFPALQLLIYTNTMSSKWDKDEFAQLCVKFEQTDIKVEHTEHSLELLEKMTGPHWEKYEEWEKSL